MSNILPIVVGYLLGSIPSGFIVAKTKGIDLRNKTKDGRFGAAVVKRECGLFSGILVGIMDFFKGGSSIIIAEKLSHQEWVIVLSGLAAIIGHNWSIYLKFLGGKGAATSFGNLFFLLTQSFLLACLSTAIPAFLLRKRKTTLGMRTSSFLTIILFLSTLFWGLVSNVSLTLSLSPIIFSLPMIIKKN